MAPNQSSSSMTIRIFAKASMTCWCMKDIACVQLGTGAAAIQEAKEAYFGAVILDIGLPDLDGHEVLKALSQADPQLPVIILTGHGTEQNTVGPLAKGAFAYVVKPYNSAAVKAVIRRACDVRILSIKAESAATCAECQ